MYSKQKITMKKEAAIPFISLIHQSLILGTKNFVENVLCHQFVLKNPETKYAVIIKKVDKEIMTLFFILRSMTRKDSQGVINYVIINPFRLKQQNEYVGWQTS